MYTVESKINFECSEKYEPSNTLIVNDKRGYFLNQTNPIRSKCQRKRYNCPGYN